MVPDAMARQFQRASDICNWIGSAILFVILCGAYTLAGLDAAIAALAVWFVAFVNGYLVGAFRQDARHVRRDEGS